MQYGSNFLLWMVITFLGVFVIAVMGADGKLRTALHIALWALAGIVISLVLGFAVASPAILRAFASLGPVMGIDAATARISANQRAKLEDMS